MSLPVSSETGCAAAPPAETGIRRGTADARLAEAPHHCWADHNPTGWFASGRGPLKSAPARSRRTSSGSRPRQQIQLEVWRVTECIEQTRAEPKMLRLRLTLSVLLGLQVAGTGASKVVVEACKNMMCYAVTPDNEYDNYEEIQLTNVQWLYTFVSGKDLKTATKIALDKFFDYSRFGNAADTIVPISAAWAIYAPFENGKIKQEFSFFITLPLEVVSPPDPNDSSISVVFHPEHSGYVRTFEQKTEDYERLASELKKDLEKDGRVFNNKYVYIAWFNTQGLMQIAFRDN
ncbi:uncharacterized protein LOC116972901 [Amblyraja radiata]|uniref:uncharacterized protein LOC116972901 n=1 Tax=Amblyraja radiata TaxID=386614 RepID=UPI001403A66D|nr:uncharacterized protein LOC116972901 [Amblyraja radiata]